MVVALGTPGTGVTRPAPVTDDERGPDSVECAPGVLGGFDHRLSECLGDYTMLPSLGFWCGCRCHDEEEP